MPVARDTIEGREETRRQHTKQDKMVQNCNSAKCCRMPRSELHALGGAYGYHEGAFRLSCPATH